MSRQRISDKVRSTGLVDNFVLETDQFGVHLELPGCVQALVNNVHQATLVYEYSKLPMLQIRTPLFPYYHYGDVFFLICRKNARVQKLKNVGALFV